MLNMEQSTDFVDEHSDESPGKAWFNSEKGICISPETIR